MKQAINVQISTLQAACMELTRYMTKANERFQEILSAEPECSKRWETFLKAKAPVREAFVCESFDKNTQVYEERQKQR